MRVYLRDRASHVVLWSALIVAAISGSGNVRVEAQAPSMRWDGLIELVSGRYEYQPPTTTPPIPANGPSEMTRHAVSGDGRYIIFRANATSMEGYDEAIYLRDRSRSQTQMLLNGAAFDPVISADGRHAAFTLCEPFIRPDQQLICDVWAIDLEMWRWTPLSVTASGDHGDADSKAPVLSGNGRFVVFHTSATNLVPGIPQGLPQLVLRDRDPDQNGIFDEPGATMEVVSVPHGSRGDEVANGPSDSPEVSDDGRYVAFRSAASNLVPGDHNNAWDVFRRDRWGHRTKRLNLHPAPIGFDESPYSIDSPAISMTPDGRFVAFASADPLLAPASIDDYNNVSDVFVFDAQSSYLERIDIGWGPPVAMGVVPGNGPTDWPTLSADGRYVSVQSSASNVENPGLPGSTHTYVVDRMTKAVTRVSMKPDGTEPDRDAVRPSISADGSLVTFVSQAFNLTPNVYTEHDRIYAAAHLEITPAEQFVSGGGGVATFTVTAQQHTQWWIDWTDWQYWLWFENPPMSVGNGTIMIRANEANPAPTRRSATIRIFEKSAVFTQLEGLSLTSVSPAEGPDTGGTQVTIRGTGFEPGMNVMFDGFDALAVEVVDSTTLVATTPPHPSGLVWIAVFSGAPDYRNAWIDEGFRYRDTTPPMLWYGLEGASQDGWYRSDVTIHWAVWDPESQVTAMTGCDYTVVTTDTAGTTFTCAATSEGGTATESVTIKRDTVGPSIDIAMPMSGMRYPLGATVYADWLCTDALSGIPEGGCLNHLGQTIDTLTVGTHRFWANAIDRAGNEAHKEVEYTVVADLACLPPQLSLQAWWRFEQDGFDALQRFFAHTEPYSEQAYGPGVHGFAWTPPATGAYLRSSDSYQLFPSYYGLTAAAWVKPTGQIGESGTILAKPAQYRVARYPDGTLRWAFNTTQGFSWVDTGATIPLNVWSHVAVTYENGVVRSYINGNLVHTTPLTGTLTASEPWYDGLTIGGRADLEAFFLGALDDVQVYDRPLAELDLQAIVAAAGCGLCVQRPATLELFYDDPVGFGQTFPMRAVLRDEQQNPIPDRWVIIHSYISQGGVYAGTASWMTDANGEVQLDVPINANAPFGPYPYAFTAYFEGDAAFQPVYLYRAITLTTGTPTVTWPALSPITYGMPLNATQLSATASVDGLFEFSPGLGTILPAGTHTLNVTFHPFDGTRYSQATASTTLTVTKAQPTVHILGGTYEYDGAPKPAEATITGALGESLPVTLTYNNSSNPPVDAGSYWAHAYYPGSENYNWASGSAQIRIEQREPIVTIGAGPFTFDGQPHPATVQIRGINGESLGPYAVTYNGGSNVPVSAGTHEVRVYYNGSRNYKAMTYGALLVIRKATPSITVTGGTVTYTGSPRTASATVRGVDGNPLSPVVITYDGSTTAPVNAGTYAVVARYDGSLNYEAVSGTASLTITKGTPAITWPQPSAIVYGTALDGVQLNATAGVPGTFAYSPATGSVLDAGSRTLAVTFSPADSANYNTASANVSLTVGKATPEVTVIGGTFTYDGTAHAATASVAGVGGASLGPVTITYNGSPDAPITAGTYEVVASYAGNGNYNAASATSAITITKATPIVGWEQPAAIVYGTPLGASQLNATSSVPGTFAYSPAAGRVLNAGAGQVLNATFTPTDAANYNETIVNTAIDVQKATPAITWNQPAPIVFGTALDSAQLNATANVAGAFAYSPAAGSVLSAGASQTLTATFTPADSGNYNSQSASTAINVSKATPAVTVTGGSFTFDGQPHPATGSVTGVGGAVLGSPTFSYNGASQPPVNAGSYDVVASYAGSANYESASATATIAIARAQTSLSWNQPAAIVYGTALGAAQLNASSNTAGTFAYTPAAGTVLNAGGHTLTATFTPADSTNYTGGQVSTTIGVSAAPLTIRANDAAKPFGAPMPAFTASAIGFVNGDTFASLSGTIAFATSATAQSPVGTYAVTPSGLASPNYAISYVNGTLAIVRGGVAVSLGTIPAPSGLDQLMTFTAGVAAASPAAGAPEGLVQFFDGPTLLGSSPLASGSASFTTAGLAAGDHTIEARYSGDTSFEPGTAFAPHVVNGAEDTPVVAITSSRNPANAGQSVTLTANLTMASGPVSGSVDFYDGGTLLGTSVISAGRATFTTTAFSAGSHAITVWYAGSASAPPVRSGVFVQAVGSNGWKNRATSMTLSGSPNPSTPGSGVTLTANVTGSTGSIPTGRILFMVNGDVVGSATGVTVTPVSGSTARATLVLPGLVGGQHTITATYLGDSNYRGSTGAVVQVVQ